jgi:hypothetical protein
MKTTILMFFALLFATMQNANADIFSEMQISPPDTLKFESSDDADETEYELIIFDPGFDRWFARNSRPQGFYELTYLENWNRQLAQQWNTKLGTSRRWDCAPQTYLDYDPRIDYGKELNYKLFFYFRYMHEKCRIFDQTPGEW